MPLTPALGTPLLPLPLMSVHAAPPLTVCQTCPRLTPPMATPAWLVFPGLNATPPIQPLGSTMFAILKAGRLPVISVQTGGAAVVLVLMKTLPSRLAVITTVALDGPAAISCSRSVYGTVVFATVRSPLSVLPLPRPEVRPAGTTPAVDI